MKGEKPFLFVFFSITLVLTGCRSQDRIPAPTEELTPVPAAGVPLVGVIRYNQFFERGTADLKTLSPNKWHDRIPWYLDVDDNKVYGDCLSQEEFDQDMEYAITANIDYFAHLNVLPNDPAAGYHLASRYKQQVKFCLIFHIGVLCQQSDVFLNNWVNSAVNWFQDTSYLKVLNDRPLVYLFDYNRKIIDLLLSKVQEAGLPDPYMVSVTLGRKEADIDGYSSYGFFNTGLVNYQGYPFVFTMEANIKQWDSLWTSYGENLILPVSLGNDQRPRWEIPPSWGAFPNPWFEQPAMEQIIYVVGKALDFLKEHPTRLNIILIYAWDEVAEGGWLVPTYTEGTGRVRALGAFLARYKEEKGNR